jgi:hypothetical protein
MRKTTLLAVILLAAAGPGARMAAAADVSLSSCPSASEGRLCVPVKLAAGGKKVASAGVTIAYDTTALRLPGGAADVKAGSALASGQQLAATVSEDSNTGSGRVQVTVTPPVRLPIPVLGDGTVAEVCFTPPSKGSGAGCSAARLVSVELGDDTGRQIH